MAYYFNKDKETDWATFGGIRGDIIWKNFNIYSTYKDCYAIKWLDTTKYTLEDSKYFRDIKNHSSY